MPSIDDAIMNNQLKGEWLSALKVWLDGFDASSFPGGWRVDVANTTSFPSIRLSVPEGSCRAAFFLSGHDQTPREAINGVFEKWREAIEDWERDGRAQDEAQGWIAGKQHLIGRIAVRPSFETVRSDGRERQKIRGFEIRTYFVPDQRTANIVFSCLTAAGAESVSFSNMGVSGFFPVTKIGLAEAALEGGLLELFERTDCESCGGTGCCTRCDGEGCADCDGDPECGECYYGQVYAWKDMP